MTDTAPVQSLPRLAIAAPFGRSGKTTVTVGLAAAFAARGLVVQPFKKGPDYIDPSWLSAAAGRPCRTLDSFFMPTPAELIAAFVKGASSEISLIEGNHGLYDSSLSDHDGPDEGAGSTAALARILAVPVLLVVSAVRMGRSGAALVLGYQKFEPETRIAGVILNHVASARHEDKLRGAIERYCGIRVLGALPSDPSLAIPDRHLGLLPHGEDERQVSAIEACRVAVEQRCDLDAILAVARDAPSLPAVPALPRLARPASRRIAVFRDRIFTFYYHENLEALTQAGSELVFVDALRDEELPEADLLYIGGGFPEVFMEALQANAGLRHAVRTAAEHGLPIYAECGGLMYLARSIRWGRRRAEMAGVLPVHVEVAEKPQGHGYVLAQVVRSNPFFAQGSLLRGHEFHNSRVVANAEDLSLVYSLSRGRGIVNGADGLAYRNVLASYTHLHVAGAPGWANGLVNGL